jgi:hemerythrin-like domain-containing protein
LKLERTREAWAMRSKGFTRRAFLAASGGVAGMLATAGTGSLFVERVAAAEKEGVEVSPAEDLMREHGLLRRILLIYEEWVRRLGLRQDGEAGSLAESAGIIRSFVEDYHEKLEEEYLFPRMKKAGSLADLVDVLFRQHQAGRRLTAVTLRLSGPQALRNSEGRRRLSGCLRQFIRMYRPHAAREDTVLFPAFHGMLEEHEYDALGDAFEKKENDLFGENGFEHMVARVESIEKKLGIYDLARYTPPR